MEKVMLIPSKLENLRTIEKMVDDISTEHKINSDIYGNILIAALEAANNAILHGNQLDEKKDVRVQIMIEEDILKLRIEDQGKGFDYKNIPDPTAPENIENVNGRGVFLMEKLSDKLEFFDEGATVELEFNLNKGAD
ncbi:MAG: ATP-binding protein [Bacteroidetes bacterium]|jgi:serine/threonine-protein kinase RsbW|nr:ATP-binding protein [Bacteroidota bacterium]